MHKLLSVLCALFLSVVVQSSALAKEKPAKSLPIDAYLVKEVGGSELLMAKNKDKQVSPASLTKILTSIIAIESGRLDEEVVITQDAVSVEPSKAGFEVGDRIKLLDLVKAAMVNSSNDAAFAIGIHLGGTVPGFARQMNAKAARIGMAHSNFTNPAGFDRGEYAGNYSTAGDLLKMAEYAIRSAKFNEIARLSEVTVVEQESGKAFQLDTHNKLLDRYPYAVGIKTGFTSKAGRCLIARARKDDKDILLVMMKARIDRWNAAEEIFEKAFGMEEPEPEIIEASPATSGKKAKSSKRKATGAKPKGSKQASSKKREDKRAKASSKPAKPAAKESAKATPQKPAGKPPVREGSGSIATGTASDKHAQRESPVRPGDPRTAQRERSVAHGGSPG